MTIKQPLAKPKLLLLPMMAVLMLWSMFGHFAYGWLYWLVTIVLFAATFIVIGWHLVLSARSFASVVSTIGKPSHPRLFGMPKWKVYLGLGSVLAVVLFVSIEVATRKMVIYQDGLRDVRSSAAAKLALGDDLRTGWFANSSMETQGDNGHADIDLSITGNRGKGRLYIRGVELNGRWLMADLYIIKADSDARIDIER
jgi:hypothetical protein